MTLFGDRVVVDVTNYVRIKLYWASLVAQRVKDLPANSGDVGLIPGLGRCLEKEMAAHSIILAWRIPWTEEPGRLQSMGL